MTDGVEVAAAARRRRAQAALAAAGVSALVVFALALIAGARQTPGIVGLLRGAAAGLFAALFIGGGVAWVAMGMLADGQARPIDAQTADELEGALGPVLAELEAARREVVRQVNARAATRVPAGAAAGAALWALEQWSGRPDADGLSGVLFNLLASTGMGAMAGYVAASSRRKSQYAQLYKGRVLPLLAARFGDLSFRSPAQIPLGALAAEKLFDDFDDAAADNEFFGTHRGLPVSIATLRLTSGSGEQQRLSFEGLVVEVTLPRNLRGTTVVIAGRGAFARLRAWLTTSDRRRVDLEDPRFAAVYDVWSTDQVAARALLTPAFMERLLALVGPGSAIDGRPLLVARDNRLTLVVPRVGRDHFQVPGFRQAAASRASLVALHDQLAGVIAITDAVIDLEFTGSLLDA